MEAGTGGPPAADPQAELAAKLDTLEQGIEAMRARVNGDLEALKAELQAEHDQNENVDLTVAMERIDIIISTVASIDPSSPLPPEAQPGQQEPPVAEQPPAEEPPVEAPPADQPPVEAPPSEPTPGEQGDQVEAPTTLYWYDGDPASADTSEFSDAGVQSPDGTRLFTFNGDQPGQPPQGESVGTWHVYHGEAVPVAEPAEG